MLTNSIDEERNRIYKDAIEVLDDHILVIIEKRIEILFKAFDLKVKCHDSVFSDDFQNYLFRKAPPELNDIYQLIVHCSNLCVSKMSLMEERKKREGEKGSFSSIKGTDDNGKGY